MSTSLKEIEQEALRLPVTEREKLVSNLLQSIHGQEINEIDESWLSIAEERFESLVSGKDPGISEKDFFMKVNKNLQWK
jgi:putative addiction module component (TIGR02574 family)